ncbi:MAG: hypothetical protein CK424_04825 [Legionella sp.]|nr:MAG: hypothetical protein CK424_04825 [Legionella sp.]
MFLRVLCLIGILFAKEGCCENTNAIVKNYQENFYKLPLLKQEHFSVRMYLLTGDTHYITPIVSYSYFLSQRYQRVLAMLDHPRLIAAEENTLLSLNKKSTKKRKRYNQYIARFSGMSFYLNLLIITNKAFSYHLENTPLFPDTARAVRALKRQKKAFKAFILNETSIKVYSAQLINYVVYLHDLGIIDLIKPYTEQFRAIFPDTQDDALSTIDYESKIYGLTHFITAASRYYKNLVSYQDYRWIIDYFENNIDQIIARTENDVIAEVGVCLLLVAHDHSVALEKIKRHLNKEFDSKHALIKSKSNNTDFIYGEHRNILTLMIFNWKKHIGNDPFIDTELNKVLHNGIDSTLKTSL